MSMWGWILIACVIAFATKLVGYLMPQSWLDNERVQRTANAVTIGLLASLVAMNALGDGTSLTVDSRLGALIAAAVALICRAPFLVVVIVGAAAAAGLRLLGFP